MAIVATDAVVLHAFDYLESSRILRLLTREGGMRSVLAKGARRSARRFGSALDLYAQGVAQLYVKEGRDLDTLSAFEVTASRAGLAEDMGRFAGASALAELAMRFGRQSADVEVYELVVAAFDAIAAAPPERVAVTTLAALWRLVAELGVAPAVDVCASCHQPLEPLEPVLFSHSVGGALCARCGRLATTGRRLPAEARATLRSLIAGETDAAPDDAALRAHQRLLREFVQEHLGDGRPLGALAMWEDQRMLAR